MARVLLWADDTDLGNLGPALRVLDRECGGIDVIGVAEDAPVRVARSTAGGGQVDIPRVRVDPDSADLVLVAGRRYSYAAIAARLAERGIGGSRVLADRTVCVPNFTLGKYRLLRESRLSIISVNCFGGLVSHLMCLPFRSPFVNLWCMAEPFVAMLEHDPRLALRGSPRYLRTEFNPDLGIDYPVCGLNGLELYMSHYPDLAEAKAKWHERFWRINWYNLLVFMYSDDPGLLARLNALPFPRKVCLTSLDIDLPCAWRVPGRLLARESIWNLANLAALNKLRLFDLWDLLLYGKRTPLIDEGAIDT